MSSTRSLYAYNSPFGLKYIVFVHRESYPDGSVRIQLYDSSDGTPYATATCKIQENLDPGEVPIKNWSENEGMLDFLIDNKFIERPHRYIKQGFVNIPICKII